MKASTEVLLPGSGAKVVFNSFYKLLIDFSNQGYEMFYFEENANIKPKIIAKQLNTTSEKVSEWANDLERYGIIHFSKTPFGSFIFKESEIKILREYGIIKMAIGNPRDAIDILKETKFIPVEKEDMSWSKNLKFAIWRRH